MYENLKKLMALVILAFPLIPALAGCSEETIGSHKDGLVRLNPGKWAPYPPDLERQLIQGRVVADCSIDADGVPRNCVILDSTDHRFDAAELARNIEYAFWSHTLRHFAEIPSSLDD